jgi:hypothetical protein
MMGIRAAFGYCTFLLVVTSLFGATTDSGSASPQAIYQAALKEFKAAESDCGNQPTAGALTRLAKAAQALAKATTRLEASKAEPTASPATRVVAVEHPVKLPGGETNNFFKMLSDHHLSLSESPGAGERNPARFSYSQDLRKGTTGAQFDTDFYLNWDLDPGGIPTEFFLSNQSLITNALSLSAQGKLSSTDTQSTDAWRFRFEDQLVDIFPKGSFVLNASVKEESDRDFHAQRVGTEIWTTITDTSLFIGGGPSKSWIVPQWRPYLGVDIGGYPNSDTLPADANSTVWLFGRLTGRLSFPTFAKELAFDSLYLYVDDNLRYLAETSRLFNYLKAGFNCNFTKDLGLGLEYSYGNDSPKFLEEHMVNVSLTLKF